MPEVSVPPKLLRATRYLLLPIRPDQELFVALAIRDELIRSGVQDQDVESYIRMAQDALIEDSNADSRLCHAVRLAIEATDNDYGEVIGKSYFELLVRVNEMGYHDMRRSLILLSQLRNICFWSKEQRISAGKVARYLSSSDRRLANVPWRTIQSVLSKLKLEPKLTVDMVEDTYQRDVQTAREVFVDMDVQQCTEAVAEVARKLGVFGDLSESLHLLIKEGAAVLPYLQLLHYQCTICEYYDHAVTTLYEFAPRGQAALHLFKKYSDLVHTGNPILNNAKAVDRVDTSWANSKEAEKRQALALVEILEGLDEMSYSASHELAQWIRAWIIRYLDSRRNGLANNRLATVRDLGAWKAHAALIAQGNTESYGVLEQRIVEVFGSAKYRKEAGWISRGLGDSVNASNTSRKKLGDIDFQNVTSGQIVAIESHGGRMTLVYLEEHLRSLKKLFPQRLEEMISILDLSKWSVEIIFVAHSFETNLPNSITLDDVTIQLTYMGFKDLLGWGDDDEIDLLELVNTTYVARLNSQSTPSLVREQGIHYGLQRT